MCSVDCVMCQGGVGTYPITYAKSGEGGRRLEMGMPVCPMSFAVHLKQCVFSTRT